MHTNTLLCINPGRYLSCCLKCSISNLKNTQEFKYYFRMPYAYITPPHPPENIWKGIQKQNKASVQVKKCTCHNKFMRYTVVIWAQFHVHLEFQQSVIRCMGTFSCYSCIFWIPSWNLIHGFSKSLRSFSVSLSFLVSWITYFAPFVLLFVFANTVLTTESLRFPINHKDIVCCTFTREVFPTMFTTIHD